jgi:hypothetical protein
MEGFDGNISALGSRLASLLVNFEAQASDVFLLLEKSHSFALAWQQTLKYLVIELNRVFSRFNPLTLATTAKLL